MPRPGPRKYEPLRAYLAGQPADVGEVTLRLAEIEAIVGAPLPATARLGSFWANGRLGLRISPQARSWRAAGWRVARTLPPRITFRRLDSTPSPLAPRRP